MEEKQEFIYLYRHLEEMKYEIKKKGAFQVEIQTYKHPVDDTSAYGEQENHYIQWPTVDHRII